MRRKILTEIPEGLDEAQTSRREHKTFQMELITPLFGGDAESWKLNLDEPIRSQSVKGHLRFWWRTFRAEDDAQALLDKENRLWGGKYGDKRSGKHEDKRSKSAVSISITNQTFDKSNDCITFVMENNHSVKEDGIPKYVLFPIISIVGNGESIHCIKKMQFQLHVSYNQEDRDEVLQTLKLWVLFGGVGARTRRGTGSLYCEELLQEFRDAKDVSAFVRKSAPKVRTPSRYPVLTKARLACKESTSDADRSWFSLLQKYGEFRQYRAPGKGPAPGRSYWPEPDALRRLTGQNEPRHTPNHPDGIWFPRAAYGLPIMFKFKDHGDPGGASGLELNLRSGDRLPSPVILKALRLPSGKVYQMGLVFDLALPDKLQVNNLRSNLDSSAIPANHKGKIMLKSDKANDELKGRDVYQALFDRLGLRVLE